MGAAGADPKAGGLARRSLLGRDQELERLGGMIDQIGRRGGTLVVRGEAGIGKSALLEAAGERARERGATVVTTTGTQSEARFAFGGLHQLLLPFLDGLDQLPDPQRMALDVAFGVAEGDAPDVFLVGLATLGVVTEREAQTPLLLVVDDAHWLDRSSAEVLAFVARRLEMEPVVLLFAVRDGVPSDLDEAGLPDLVLAGLDDDASRTLLDRNGAGLPDELKGRILAEAAGNPLALIELPAAAVDLDLTRASEPLPLTARLEAAFATRLSALDDDVRALLLLAALEDGELAELSRAAEALLGASRRPRRLDDGRRVRPRNDRRRRIPVPAPVDQVGRPSGGDRRATPAGARRARTDACGRSGPGCLAPGGGRTGAGRGGRLGARCRGGSGEAPRRPRRRVRGAGAGRRADRRSAAPRVAARAGGRSRVPVRPLGGGGAAPSRSAPARTASRRRGREGVVRSRDAHESVVRRIHDPALRARRGRPRRRGDDRRALEALGAVSVRSYWDQLDDEHAATRVGVRRAARRAGRRSTATGGARAHRSGPSGPRGHRADRADVAGRHARPRPVDGRRPGRDRPSGPTTSRSRSFAPRWRDSGPTAGWRGSPSAWRSRPGPPSTAAPFALRSPVRQRRQRLAEETRQFRYVLAAKLAHAIAAAERGEEETADHLIAGAEAALVPMGANPQLGLIAFARGRAALAAERPGEAYHYLLRIFDPADASYQPYARGWALADLVDAAVRGDGDLDLVRGLLREWEETAADTSAPHLEVQLSYAAALLADGATAEERFQAALTSSAVGWPFYTARAQLAYGAWLRRQRRGADSRTPLREAARIFDALGAAPLRRARATRAARLRRACAPARPRGVDRVEPSGAPDRAAGGRGPLEPRDRRAALSLPPDGEHAPVPALPEARHHLAHPAARCARAVARRVAATVI